MSANMRLAYSKANQKARPQQVQSTEAEEPPLKMEPCLGGCGKKINANSPWGRYSDGGVCGTVCDANYLEARSQKFLGIGLT